MTKTDHFHPHLTRLRFYFYQTPVYHSFLVKMAFMAGNNPLGATGVIGVVDGNGGKLRG
jgi:hypothetical protein